MPLILLLSGIAATAATESPNDSGVALQLTEGDRVVFVGNTFAERLRQFGHFETLLTTQFPELNLTFRNLGWSADEVDLRPRPLNFGDIHTHLTNQRADVIFACYGLNESFAGIDRAIEFEDDLRTLVREFLSNEYNGVSSPRVVLVSPFPQEKVGLLPDVTERNDAIHAYVQVMARVARTESVTFLNLFEPIAQLTAATPGPQLTFNGIHLTQYGDWVVANVMMRQLGFDPSVPRIELSFAPKRLEADAVSLRMDDWGEDTISLETEFNRLPPPIAPGVDDLSPPMDRWQPTIVTSNLAAGTYALKVDGRELPAERAERWEAGRPLADTAAQRQTDELRQTINYKNQLFFDRWRAVNGYYIYGGRKEPFGVVSFPPEMKRFDERIAEFERRIHELNRVPETPETITFSRVGE